MALTPAWLDELRSRTTLSSLIGRTVKITRAGREYKACCPFHAEKTPSFTINDEKGFYHCFGCGAHGDAIRWMTDQRGLPFMDAVKELAAMAGMEVPAPDPRAAERQEAAKSLRDVTAAAAAWFQQQLEGVEGAAARAYLAQRGIAEPVVRAFGIGYAPDSRTALKAALSDFLTPMLVEAGMLIEVDDKAPYDRFRGRVMIPILDARGRVIAFGGRVLGDGEPKYLNSPDTPLFDKGRTLYNLDRASPASRRSGRVIVVEGYMDVIALAGAGVDDAVAPLGTALTEAQLALLWRMVPVPLLCFDGDAAGQKAAFRAAMRALPLLGGGRSLAFVTLPAGQDPDDVVRRGGAGALTLLLDQAQPLVDRLWAHEVAAAPLTTPEARAGLKSRLMAHADMIADQDVAHHYREAFRERMDALFRREGQGRRDNARDQRNTRRPDGKRGPWNSPAWASHATPPGAQARHIHAHGIDQAVAEAIVGGLLRHPAAIARNAELLGQMLLADAALSALLDRLIDVTENREIIDCAETVSILAGTTEYNKAVGLLRADQMRFSFNRVGQDDANQQLADAAGRDLDEAIALVVARPELQRRMAAATAHFAATLDDAGMVEQQRLLAMDRAMTQRLVELADPGAGSTE